MRSKQPLPATSVPTLAPRRRSKRPLPSPEDFLAFATKWRGESVPSLEPGSVLSEDLIAAYAAQSGKHRATAYRILRATAQLHPASAATAFRLALALQKPRHQLITGFLLTKAEQDWGSLLRFATQLQYFITWWLKGTDPKGNPRKLEDFPAALVAPDIREFQGYLERLTAERKLRGTAARAYLGHAVQWLRWLAAEGHIATWVVRPQGGHFSLAPRQIPLPTMAQFQALAQTALRSHPTGPMFAILALAMTLGVRGVELCRLRRSDFDWSRATVWVTGKGLIRRELPVLPPVMAVISQHFAASPGRDFAFTRNGHALLGRDLQRMMEELSDLAGVTLPHGRQWHHFRHALLTYLVRAGAEPTAVQQLAGHAYLDTVAGYIARDPGVNQDLLKRHFPDIEGGETN